jgi:hypothetical protein
MGTVEPAEKICIKRPMIKRRLCHQTFGAHANAKDQSDDEQRLPAVRKCRCNGRSNENKSGYEDGTTSTEVII